MGELYDRFERRVDGNRNPIAQGPMVATAVTGKGRAYVRAPKHYPYGVGQERGSPNGETIGGTHRGTMESNSALVNDRKSQRLRLAASAIVDDQD
jgi:hypothetical protein